MCGINGIFAYAGDRRINATTLRATRDHMIARGPDGHGEWLDADARIALGHRRLAIIDLSPTGAQPMVSADQALVVTFNGEIYNYRELRKTLEETGCVFSSRSDTEVLLHLFRRHGAGMLPMLRGMFAFAIWDVAAQRLFLARDPYGIKPLYYSDDGKYLQFASSVKALLAGGEVSREPAAAGLVGFQVFGNVPEPWTCYRAIKALPAGTWAAVDRSGMQPPQAYFSIAEAYCRAERAAPPKQEAAEYLRACVLDSVRHHVVADVPVGAFLSAGIDSGALVGLMRDAGQNEIRTITLAFEPYRNTSSDESVLAEVVAKQYGATHTTRWINAAEFHADLPGIIEAMDQPSIDGVNTWFISKAAREIGLKVAISGVGGDELVGGYNTFVSIPKLVRRSRFLPRGEAVGAIAGRALQFARKFGLHTHPKAAGVLSHGATFARAYFLQRIIHLPAEFREPALDNDFLRKGLEELQPERLVEKVLEPTPARDFSKLATLESSLYMRNQLLRDTDWAGMAHSLEIRTPLVDSELLIRLAPLFAHEKTTQGKQWLAQSPTSPLPLAVTNRRKTGFGIPIKAWYEGLYDTLPDAPEAGEDIRLWSRTWMKQVAALSGQGDLLRPAVSH